MTVDVCGVEQACTELPGGLEAGEARRGIGAGRPTHRHPEVVVATSDRPPADTEETSTATSIEKAAAWTDRTS
jgi:hypothetical protein